MDEQDPYLSQEPANPVRPGRGESFRGVIFGRGAGWAVSAVLAGTVVALSILLAEGQGQGPTAVRVIGAPPFARAAPAPLGGQVQLPPGVQALGPGNFKIMPRPASRLLAPDCRRIGVVRPSPSASASPTPTSSAAAGASTPPGPQGSVTIVGPGGGHVTCVIQVKPGR